MYTQFTGKKFYPTNTTQVRDDTQWWTNAYKEKVDFKMTKEYKAYLRNKREERRKLDIQVLRHKLEWQMRTYGEVDPIDYGEFIALIKNN